MKVIVSKYLNVRVGKPSVNAPCYQYLAPGSEIEVDGKQYTGDKYEGLDIWMKDGAGNYYWSGGIAEITTGSQSFPLQFDASKVAPWSRLNFEVSRFWNFTTGKNITVAVIDSGITAHYDLKDAIDSVYQKSFITPDAKDIKDIDGHGTHVAGIIAARGKHDILGVAPEARILPLRIALRETDTINTKCLIEAIKYATSLAHVRIINLSLNSDSNDIDNEDNLKIAIQGAIEANKIIVSASGNFGWEFILPPAKFDKMISVSSVEQDISFQNNKYKLSSFSNYGVNLTTCCPGLNVESCANLDSGKVERSGTSMACAYLSGLIALKLQLYNNSHTYSQESITKAIKSSVFQMISRDGFTMSIINPSLFINF